MGSIAISPDGRFAYVAAFDTITTFARDQDTGALIQLPGAAGCLVRDAPGTPGCGPARGIRTAGQIAISGDGRNLYVSALGRRTSGLGVFTRDPATGVLQQLAGVKGCVNTGLSGCMRARQLTGPMDIVVGPDDRHVYVVASASATYGGGIAAYTRNRLDGSLRQLAGPRGCVNGTGAHGCLKDPRTGGGPAQLALAPDGRALYTITSSRNEGPRSYPILRDGRVGHSAATGRWPSWYREFGGDNPEGIGVAVDGRVYVAGHSDGFFIFVPNRTGLKLRRVACWAYNRPRCRRSRAFGFPAGSDIVASPDAGTIYTEGDGGVITVGPRSVVRR